jgi:short-subunit dehydrogenase
MKHYLEKVVLITGASSGIGKACAEFLFQKNCIVYGTGRDHLPAANYHMLKMDARDDESVKQAIHYIIDREKRIDVLINNAGIAAAGAIEDTSIKEAESQLDTNFFGNLRVTNAVLPFLRKQNSGLIINISSIGGLISVPFTGLYCASKFALEGLSEALRYELKKFDIDVVLIEPGDVQSGLTARRVKTKQSQENSPYYTRFKKTLAVIEYDEMNGAKKERIAKKVYKIMTKRRPKLRYAVGLPQQRLAVILKKILPSTFFEKIIASHYKI